MQMSFQKSWFSRPPGEYLSADLLIQKLQHVQCKGSHSSEDQALNQHAHAQAQAQAHVTLLRRKDLIPEELVCMVDRAKQSTTISAEAFSKARGKANPYECLGKGPRGSAFINRSALKMANMDYCFNIFGENADQCSSFLDVCGGPGGFTEYVLSKYAYVEGACITGFGMSLAIPAEADRSYTSLNWSLSHLHCPPVISITDNEQWHTKEAARNNFFIVRGEDGTGSVFSKRNHQHLGDAIASATQHLQVQHDKVDFVCGDGGFDDGKQDLSQEVIHYDLIVCQIIAMLKSLKEGGHFFVKLFATHEYRTYLLLFVLSHLFESICIIKPVTSRPTSDERYLFGHSLKEISPSSSDRMLLYLWSLVDESENKESLVGESENKDRDEDRGKEGDGVDGLHDKDFLAFVKSANTELLYIQLLYFYKSIHIMRNEHMAIAESYGFNDEKECDNQPERWKTLLREMERTLTAAHGESPGERREGRAKRRRVDSGGEGSDARRGGEKDERVVVAAEYYEVWRLL